MKAFKFRMIRRGKFELNYSSENQCKDVGHKNYSYICECTFPDRLDENGFIIDHNVINESIQDSVKSTSCEEIVAIVVNNLVELFDEENIKFNKIVFRVKPSNAQAYLEGIYKNKKKNKSKTKNKKKR